ncbi:hypothetical protein CU111_09510 [Klebsiella pneumoniae]|nr:hypothetical protein CU111_09510 [Klebsiella pneumoniae]
MVNEAIIEVKTTKLERDGIEKDITNLSIFLEKAEYKRAIFLIFGDSFSEKKLETIKSIYSQLNDNGINVQPIEIWLHDQCGNSARKIHTLEIAS